MAYKVSHHSPFKKNISNIQVQNQNIILNVCDKIQASPNIGEAMKGSFKKLGFKYYRIRDTNPEYRIIYKVYHCKTINKKNIHLCNLEMHHNNKEELINCNGLVDFIVTGTREFFNNFYGKSEKEIKIYLK